MSKFQSLESKIRNVIEGASVTGTEARTKIRNVSRIDDAGPESEKSELSKENQIKTKIIDEGKPLMSQPNFGLPSSVINSVKSILEKKDNKMPVGEVNLNPETDDAVDGTDEKDEKPTKKPKKPDSVYKKDDDVDNDGDVDKTDSYLKNRRKVIDKAVKEEVEFSDEELARLEEIDTEFNEATNSKSAADDSQSTNTGSGITKEETELDEARGRPRKNPLPDDQEPDAEGHMHPIMQLRRISQSIEGREAPFTHADGTTTRLTRPQARMMVANHDIFLRTTQEKDAFARALHANNASMRKAMGSN